MKIKFTKKQIYRNRIIFALVCVIIFTLSYYAVDKIVTGYDLINSESEPVSSVAPENGDDGVGIDIQSQGEQSADIQSSPSVENDYVMETFPTLVNKSNPISQDDTPELLDVSGGYKFRKEGAAALTDMIAAAKKDGISLTIVSAYRTDERQTSNYNNRVKKYIDGGKSIEEATALTEQYIAPPGCSEHTLGLAVDFNSLYESFDSTKEFAWLQLNCTRFGFILRYQKNKTDITGFNYEPWHYRFVGSNHAVKITEGGFCLEEYYKINNI